MTIHKFNAEGRFDCDLDEVVKGKVWAFVAVVDSRGIGLGVAIANSAGYIPIPRSFAYADKYDEMSAHADELNTAEGLTPEVAIRIIASTMAAQNVQKAAERRRQASERRRRQLVDCRSAEDVAEDEGTDPIDERAAEQDACDRAVEGRP